MSTTSWLVLTVVLVVAGCGSSSPPPTAETAKKPAATAQPERRETVFDPWIGTIDRAKGVQSTVDEQAAEQRRKIEEASR